MMTSHDIALQVMQEAVLVMFKWVQLETSFQISEKYSTVTKAKKLLSWEDQSLGSLRLLFDFVQFSKNESDNEIEKNSIKIEENYCPAKEISDSDPSIPYPIQEKPDLTHYKETIKTALTELKQADWNNLSLLTLFVEKYGSCLSFIKPDIALVDIAKSTAAVACAIAPNLESEAICLVAGDLSGIQNFIYTISSDGALKSLRARSFYLELVAEEIVQQLLEELDLPRTSIIYAGGGNLYLLVPKTDPIEKKIQEVQSNFNRWLYNQFQGKIFLALACHFFPVAEIATKDFAKNWNEAIKKVNKQKSRKFIDCISDLLSHKISYEQKCRVCHRDDTNDLKLLNDQEPDSPDACPICREMFQLGGKLLKVETIIRSREEKSDNADKELITFESPRGKVYYHIFNNWKQIVKDADTVLLVNDWTVEHYQFRHFQKAIPLLLGNYAQESKKEPGRTMRAEEFAENSLGINRVGYLRIDVDNLGKIFAKGLQKSTTQNLPRIAGLSRQMTYFFKVYLNSLAKERCANLPKGAKSLNESDRPNLLFIYAGGDDLFISGTWNEVVDFAFDIYQAFRAYTGYNQDITLSGGISLADIKFPLYQAAYESGEAEEKAKANGRDSLGLFGQVFKWYEWLGTNNPETIEPEIKNYLSSERLPSLFGILPFVEKLYKKVEGNYSRSFVRNLLATAQIQNQMIREIEQKRKQPEYPDQARDIRYYLHLPKIAYTLARLPKEVLKDEKFQEFRQSLKSPYNAPYFQAIATWIELLTRKESHESNDD